MRKWNAPEKQNMDVISDIMGPLKPVFDACDQNGDGFVKTKDLVLLLKNHTGSEEVNKSILVEKL